MKSSNQHFSINTSQSSLMKQVEQSFETFRHFTPEATKQLTESLHGRLEELDIYTQTMSLELAQKRLSVKKSIEKLESLYQDGLLTKEEFAEVIGLKESALKDIKIEIAAYNESDYKTFQKGLRLIELFSSICNYMQTPGNELDKARIAKLALSNPTLKDRTIQYHYQKPFDVLLSLTSEDKWWK